MSVAYVVGLGSSSPCAAAVVDAAVAACADHPWLRIVSTSAQRASAPAGGATEARFVNAAVLVESALGPRAMLGLLRSLEARFGRVRSTRNQARSLDLDILWWSGLALTSTELTVPHPRLFERPFALEPLRECFARAGRPMPLSSPDTRRGSSPCRRSCGRSS